MSGGEQRQGKVQRPVGGLEAGTVAIKAEDGFGHGAPEDAELVLGQRRAERRHRLAEARPVQGDHVDIAFNRDQAVVLVRGLAGLVEIVEHFALVEDRRLGRVEVFRRHVRTERAAAKGDDAAALVADRKHDTVAETVIADGIVLVNDDEAGLDHLLERHALAGELVAEPRPVIAGIADAEFLLHGGGEIAVGEIAAGLGTMRRLQFGLEQFGGNFHDVIEACTDSITRHVSFGNDRHGKPGIGGETLHRFRKAQALLLDEEGEDIAARLAAEAMIAALAVVGMEARRLLAMEGAAGPVIALGGLRLAPVPGHMPADHG